MKLYVMMLSLAIVHSCHAMDQKPEYDPKEIIIKMEQLEKSLQSLQAQQQLHQSSSKPEDIVITMTLPQLLELQKKSSQDQTVISEYQNKPQTIDQVLNSVVTGVQELRNGRPYNAWHYVSSGGSVSATIAGIVTSVFTLIILLK